MICLPRYAQIKTSIPSGGRHFSDRVYDQAEELNDDHQGAEASGDYQGHTPSPQSSQELPEGGQV